MSKVTQWWSRHPLLWTTIVVLFVTILLTALLYTSIPNCKLCGQKEYHLEVDYYITTFIKVGDVDVPQQTPVYKSIRHICTGKLQAP